MDIDQALSKQIDKAKDDLVSLTQDLVRFPTVNPPGAGYTECATLLRNRLAGKGFSTELLRAKGAIADCDEYPRMNLIARTEGALAGPCIHFNSHIDVVPTGEGWSKDPFGGEISDGKIFGRGTCDMKGGLAASIIAVEALLAVWPDHPGALEISATADEETGGFAGVAWLAEQGYFSPARVNHVIIPEPFSPHRICLGHRGVWWGEITTYGVIAHGSMPFLGNCAVRHMAAVVEAFERELFPTLASRQTDMPVTPEAAQRSTLNIAAFQGGEIASDGVPAPNVPDICRLVFDRRFLQEETLEQVRAEMIAILDRLSVEREGFRYDLKDLMVVEPLMNEPDAPVVNAAADAIQAVLGVDAPLVASPGTYDQKHVARIGGVTDCIAYGPGKLEVAHQVDEYVEIEDLLNAAKVMAFAAARLLSPE